MAEATDVAIIGAGPAGSSLAIRLAQRGISTVLIDYAAEPEWRACGVFSSPLTRRHLAAVGLAPGMIDKLIRPISALNLETTRGVRCRIEYERGHACGFDRPALDVALLDQARGAGVDVRGATVAREIEFPSGRREPVRIKLTPTSARKHADGSVLKAGLVVGAGGAGFVIRGSGAVNQRPVTRVKRSGLTFHRPDAMAAAEGAPMEGRFIFGNGWYVGVAPVPRGRVNVGMVIPGTWAGHAPEEITQTLIAQFPAAPEPWMSAENSDSYRFQGVLNHGVRRVAGDRWLLVGDATGFIDPLTGEGIHRAFVSSQLGADAIPRFLGGDQNALRDYDRRLRARFRSKDVVSWIFQGFLAQPKLFDYALQRLADRHDLRRDLTLVLTDQLPATRGLDPRFLARLLRP